MKKINSLLILLLFVSGLYPQMSGTRPTPFGFDINVKPPIYYDLFLAFNPDGREFELNFAINIQYDLLFFLKTDSGYVSGYDISLNIKDQKSGESVYSQLWKELVSEKNFEITNSQRHYHINSKTFHLDFPTGKYQLNLALTDKTSGRAFKSSRIFEVPDLLAEIYLSEIIFLTQDKSQSAEIVVNETERVLEFNKDLYPYFQFKLSDAGKVRVRSELFKLDEDKRNLLRTEEKTIEDGPFYKFEEVLAKKDLEEGEYLLLYTLITERLEKTIEKKFNIIWYQKPIPMYSLELALPPMRYLITDAEWNEVNDYSEAEEISWYKTYWKEKDPNPETPLNEVQIEFYRRVIEANKKFRAEQYEGWNTDRGKALILYGEPDRIDAKRYLENAQAYEIWYYEKKNEKLIFVDKDEDGSYFLVTIEDIGKGKNE